MAGGLRRCGGPAPVSGAAWWLSLRRALAMGLLALCLALPAGTAAAQSEADYQEWEALAKRVEQTLAVGAASDATLHSLREKLVVWRDRFLTANTANSGQLGTINRRLEALPAPPAEGETEPEAVTRERETLTRQRETLQAPAVRAELAHAHADGLVREIDDVLRERQATELIQRLPSPLNPLNWTQPVSEVLGVIAAVPLEIAQLYGSGDFRSELLKPLPSVGLLAFVGILLFWRAGRWTTALLEFGEFLNSRVARFAVDILAVTLQLVLPVLGLIALLTAIGMSGILGDTGTSLLSAVSQLALTLILGSWLVLRIFPGRHDEVRAANAILPDRLAGAARRVAMGMVGVLSIVVGLTRITDELDFSEQTVGYLQVVPVILASLALYRLGRLYRRRNILPADAARAEEAGDDGLFIRRIIAVLAVFGRGVALAAPVLALAGYLNAAQALVFPACSTFLLLSATGRVQSLVAELFVVLHRGDSAAANGLGATLAGGALYLASVPLLALLWGARFEDMSEFWARLQAGYSFGGVTLSPTVIVIFLAVFAIGYGMTRFLQGALAQTILPKTRLDLGAQRAITSGAGYIGVFLAGLAAFTSTGLDLSSIAIVAGALSVGIGFGLQTIVSNFVSGIILLIERPVSEGDWIEVGGQMGIVKAIAVRATRIETFDRTDVIIPNSDLVSGLVTNWTRGNLIGRAIVPVGVAYGTDTRKAERVLREIAEAHPMVAITPPPQVLFIGFGASSLDFEIRAILRDINFLLTVKSDICHEIARRFAEEKIEIPFPQQDVWLHEAAGPRQHPIMPGQAPPPAAPPVAPEAGRRGAPDLLDAGDMDGGGGDGDGDGR